MSVEICYAGPYLDSSGYGEATRNAIQALYSAGANIKTQRITFTGNSNYNTRGAQLADELSTRDVKYKFKVIHTTPDVYKNYMEKGKYHIGHLFWETDRIPTSWVSACNAMNEIWTGTKLNAESIKASGVTVPIYIFPQAININIPDVRKFKLQNFNGTLFYSIFEWNERKNPEALLNAYWREFKGIYDVGLLIKVHKGSYKAGSDLEIIDEIKRIKNGLPFKETPRLFVCTNLLTEEEKHRLHETGDCYISSHRGEGWGIPIVEASLHKKPVISVKYGGIHEYFSSKHFYSVKYELVPVDKVYNKYYEPGMQWADADEMSLRERMREVYDLMHSESKKGLPKIKSSSAKNLIESYFNFETVGGQMLARLQAIQDGNG